MLNRQNYTFFQNKTTKNEKKLDFFNLMHYLYIERKKKNKENLVILKFVCIFAVMVGQDPHRWAPSKGFVLFSYLW